MIHAEGGKVDVVHRPMTPTKWASAGWKPEGRPAE
jgi:hypothetical protein